MWCGTQKKPPCVDSNVPVCTGTTRTCVTTCGRGAGTHGDVLNLHTEVFSAGHTGREEARERGRVSPSVLLERFIHQKKPVDLHHYHFEHFKFENRSRTTRARFPMIRFP